MPRVPIRARSRIMKIIYYEIRFAKNIFISFLKKRCLFKKKTLNRPRSVNGKFEISKLFEEENRIIDRGVARMLRAGRYVIFYNACDKRDTSSGKSGLAKKNIKDNIIGSARVASSKNLFHGCILEAKFVAVRVTITGANKVRGEAEKRVAVSIRSDSYPRCFNAAFTATFLSRPSTARINTVIPRFAIPLKRPCSRSLPRRAARPIPTD